LALLGQGVAALLMLLVIRALPSFGFVDAFNLLGVVLAALLFGAGASLLATWVGALLLDILDLPPTLSFALDDEADVWGLFVFLTIGSAISVLAGEVARARRAAEAARTRAEGLVNSLTQANQRMDEFIGIAGHELRTPLTSLKLGLELIERRAARSGWERLGTEDAALVRALVARASASAARQERLVGDMLNVARIQAGKLELHLGPLDLAALVRDCVEEQRLAHAERTLTLAGAEQSVSVIGDADQLRQVLTNYLSNALKYSSADRPVAVEIAVEGDAVRAVRVRVRDEGPGLPPEEQERIWERFHRVPGITVRSGSGVGLGLGLYIARELVERHGGQVGVESTPGVGATFWFTLPLAATPTTDE
jgi:signal transduction histidine kinase